MNATAPAFPSPARPPSRARRISVRPRLWLACLAMPCLAVAAGDRPADAASASLDDVFARLVAEEEIPGLAAVVVRGNETLFQRAYGWADLSRRTPVDADETTFPLGSISKVLTTVAVLQLVEKGRLDLDADVRRYIGPTAVDQRFAAPVTLRHLLTHTDGFDVRWLFGGAARVPQKVRPLAELVARLPPRVTPPGELYLYSDVGMTLAGYIVEQVSHEPFARYMDQQVFAPLGMNSTSFWSIPRLPASQRATGYDYDAAGQLRPVPPVYPHAVPASGANGTIADVGRFMQALLATVPPGTGALLAEPWKREMWRRQYAQDPLLPGTALAVYEFFHQRHRALVHGGLVPGFTSVVMFLPEERIGLCVLANRFDLIAAFEHGLLEQVIDRVAAADPPPLSAPAVPLPPSPVISSAHLDGTYRCDQYSRYSTDKLVVLAGLADEIRVTTQPDGRLTLAPRPGSWQPVAPLVYENEHTAERVAFRTDASGRGVRLVGSAQFMSYHRIGWFERTTTQLVLFGALGVLAAGQVLVALSAALRGRGRNALSQTQQLLALATGAAVVGYLGALWLAARGLDFATIGFGEPRPIVMLRYLPGVFAVLAALQFGLAAVGWQTKKTRRAEALVHAVGGIGVVLLVALLHYWNLFQWPFSLA